MSDDVEMPCILAPLAADSLLLPNVAVAEVLRRQRVVRAPDGWPDWCVGRIMWRGVVLPLISFEGASGGDGSAPPMSAQDGALVMNRTRNLAEFGFYAIVTRGTPRLLRLAEDDLDAVEETDQDPGSRVSELGRVQVGEDIAIIPRLTFIEDLILDNRLYA